MASRRPHTPDRRIVAVTVVVGAGRMITTGSPDDPAVRVSAGPGPEAA